MAVTHRPTLVIGDSAPTSRRQVHTKGDLDAFAQLWAQIGPEADATLRAVSVRSQQHTAAKCTKGVFTVSESMQTNLRRVGSLICRTMLPPRDISTVLSHILIQGEVVTGRL